MDLYTACPKCKTTFRVTTPQLQSSGGQVRCGFCSEVFDAFATLTAQEPRPDSTAIRAAVEPAAAPPASTATQAVHAATDRMPAAPSARSDPAAGLYEWEFRMPDAPKRTGMWLGLSALLLAVLAVQAAYAYRTELSIAVPQSRKLFEQACAMAGCSMASPALSSYLHIEASDLKAVDAGIPNEIELTLLIRNRAPVDLAHPAFELTLTDGQDQAIARRVFSPRDYLSGSAVAGAIKAGAELPVHLYLNTGEVRAAGYRLYLFYP